MFQNISIKNKILISILIVTFISIFFVFLSNIILDIQVLKKTAINSAILTAKLTGEYCITPLAFNDKDGANDLLEKLESVPDVISAYVLDNKFNLFAAYDRNNEQPHLEIINNELKNKSFVIKGYFLHIESPINYKNEYYGEIYLKISIKSLSDATKSHFFVMIIIVFFVFIFAYILALKFQELLSKPLLALSITAQEISEIGDYSINLTREGQDELSILYNSFDKMIKKINQRENDLKTSHERLITILDGLKSIVYVAELNSGKLLFSNKFAKEVFGESIKERAWSVNSKNSKNVKISSNDAVNSYLSDHNWEYYDSNNDKWYFIQDRPIYWVDGNIVILEIATDITEHKKTEQLIMASELKFRSLYKSVQAGVIVLNAKGIILHANAIASEVFQMSNVQIIGKSFIDIDWEMSDENGEIIPFEYNPAVITVKTLKRLRNAIRGIFIKDSERCRWLIINTEPIFSEDGKNLKEVMVTFSDITESKKSEFERTKLITELEQKNSELERFTYLISHDLKTPLITIRGYLGLLKKNIDENEVNNALQSIKNISLASDKMKLLLEELLRFSSVGYMKLNLQKINLRILVDDVVSILSPSLNEKHIKIHISDDLPEIIADYVKIHEIYQNLIENAIKFIKDTNNPAIEIGSRTQGDHVVLFVRDNGVGIKPEYHVNVFEIFNKLDNETEGAGVGLSIVKRIVELHHGHVWIESSGNGSGCTFCFELFTDMKNK